MGSQTNQKSGLATAGMVLGIIAAALCFIPVVNFASYILGVLALTFGIIALAKKQSLAKAIVAIVLAIAGMGIATAINKAAADALNKASDELSKTADDMSGDNTEAILKNDIQVDLGEFTVTDAGYGLQSSKMVVAVTNKLSEKKTYSIKIEAVDADGKRIADDTVYASDLGAGQSQDFDAFALVSSDKYEALKAATFKIVSVSKI